MKLNQMPSNGQVKIKTIDGCFFEASYPVTDRNFGKLLRECRAKKSLSLIRGAIMLGITVPELSQLELGKRYWLTDADQDWALAVICGDIKQS